MKKLLIIGAGGIGRGYIPWVFPPSDFEYVFDDTNEKLLNKLYKRGKYTTWCIINNKYEPLTVRINGKIPKDIDAIFVAVGPRNFLSLADRFMNTEIPIICCENDARLPNKMKEMTGNPNVFFAIPDVITSNIAPQKLLDIDSLSVVTENGKMYMDERTSFLGGNAIYLNKEDMHKEWMAKLYIHNTTHCIIAYLGYSKGYTYIHEAIEDKDIYNIAECAMWENAQMVEKMYKIDRNFVIQYALKEIKRFENNLLFDPISRVAREPMRKLALGDRLIGAAMLCLQAGIEPVNISKGIIAAINYHEPKDPDYRIMKLIEQVDREDFMQGVLHLRPEEKLYSLLLKEMK